MITLLASSLLLMGCSIPIAEGLTSSTPTSHPAQTATPFPPVPPSPTSLPTSTATVTPTPTPVFLSIAPGAVQVPILLYHHVSSEMKDSQYSINPEMFEQQIAWLHDNGYSSINITTLANLIQEGGKIPLRPVIITFDDGNLDVYQKAFPILKKYGFSATFYVVDNYINGKAMVTSDQLKELIQNGWEIGSHGNSHTDLTASGVDLMKEIRMAKLETEDRLGVTINSFAYPFGRVDPTVIDKTIRFGFTSAVGLGATSTHDRSSLFYLSRIEIANGDSMDRFISLLPWSGPN